MKSLRIYLFDIMVILYSLETKHYFHAKTRGKKFRSILNICSELFDNIEEFAITTNINFTDFNVCCANELNIGEIDAMENKLYIWEFKCTRDLDSEHFIQLAVYALLNENMKIWI